MADHGVNRRKSHYARMRQRRGKAKAALSFKRATEKIKYWWNHWHSEKLESEE